MLATLVFVEHEMERQLLKVEWVLHKMEWKSWLQILNILLNSIDWILDDNHHSIYLQQNFHILQNIYYKLVLTTIMLALFRYITICLNFLTIVWEWGRDWFGQLWFGLVWVTFAFVWSGLVWFGPVWSGFDQVWFGWVWSGLIRLGVVWLGLI